MLVYETASGAVKKVIEENPNKDIIEIYKDAIIGKLEKLDVNCTDFDISNWKSCANLWRKTG